MALALALGRRGLGNVWPNPAVGAVIVRREDGVDASARLDAARRPAACRDRGAAARRRARRAGATLYVTLEPCSHHGKTPPCADAIIAAGIARVVSALEDPNPRWPGAAMAGCARPASRSTSASAPRRRARDHAGPHPAHARRAPARHAQARGFGRRQGRRSPGAARRPSPAEAARERVHLMRAHERRHPDRHRHRAGGRSAADLPACPAWRGDRRCAWCSTQACGCRSVEPPGAERARETPIWVFGGRDAPAHGREDALRQAAVDVLRVDETGRPARPAGGAERPGRARHHPADGRGRADRCGLLRRRRSGRRGGRCSARRTGSAPTASTRSTGCRSAR